MNTDNRDDGGRIIKLLYDDLVRAHHDLNEYKLIFSEDQDQIDVLNVTGQLFFVRLHHLYWQTFVSTVSRFLDQAKTRAQSNLSFYQLLQLAEHRSFKSELRGKLELARREARTAIRARHKFVAHRDLDEALVADDQPTRVQLEVVERVYSILGECIQMFVGSSELKPWISQPGAKSVVYYLRKGYAAFELERQKLLDDLRIPRET